MSFVRQLWTLSLCQSVIDVVNSPLAAIDELRMIARSIFNIDICNSLKIEFHFIPAMHISWHIHGTNCCREFGSLLLECDSYVSQWISVRGGWEGLTAERNEQLDNWRFLEKFLSHVYRMLDMGHVGHFTFSLSPIVQI